jgi:prepilin-type N-terminal cleavage/methylation domain-containing protein
MSLLHLFGDAPLSESGRLLKLAPKAGNDYYLSLVPMKHRVNRCAFTLVELLVVVAIVAVLASLLLPSAARAKAKAHQINCINNHRQLGLAWTFYQDDNNGRLPNNLRENVLSNPSWVDSTVHGDTPGMSDPRYLIDPKRAAFAKYVRDVKIYKCPAERTVFKRAGGRTVLKLRSYSMNDYITPPGGGSWGVKYHFRRSTDLLNPANTFVFIDVEPGSMCFSTFRIPDSDSEPWFSAPGGMHVRGTALTFADGHAESKRWKKPSFRAALNSSPHPSPSDRADVSWLRRRAHHLIQ